MTDDSLQTFLSIGSDFLMISHVVPAINSLECQLSNICKESINRYGGTLTNSLIFESCLQSSALLIRLCLGFHQPMITLSKFTLELKDFTLSLEDLIIHSEIKIVRRNFVKVNSVSIMKHITVATCEAVYSISGLDRNPRNGIE